VTGMTTSSHREIGVALDQLSTKLGDTDFECWGRLWKACPSDPRQSFDSTAANQRSPNKYCSTGHVYWRGVTRQSNAKL
jgi:polyisoprenoid-binding protein YceI